MFDSFKSDIESITVWCFDIQLVECFCNLCALVLHMQNKIKLTNFNKFHGKLCELQITMMIIICTCVPIGNFFYLSLTCSPPHKKRPQFELIVGLIYGPFSTLFVLCQRGIPSNLKLYMLIICSLWFMSCEVKPQRQVISIIININHTFPLVNDFTLL